MIQRDLNNLKAKAMQQMRDKSNYYLPFSRQKMYSTMMPISFNVTLMNSDSMISKIHDHVIVYD